MKVRRIDFWPDEWLAGTGDLSLVERGVYITACALIYSRGGPITEDHLRKQCPSHGRVFNAALERLVATGKIVETSGKLDQNRCETELKHARNRIVTLRQNGSKGGRPNGLENQKVSSSRARNYQLSTKNEEKEEATNDGVPPKKPGVHHAPMNGASSSNSPAEKSSHVRGTRLPADWQPSPADCQFAVARGLDPGAVADEFADYWHPLTGSKAVKLDWSATFRNWCRRQPGRERRGDTSIAAALSRVRFADD